MLNYFQNLTTLLCLYHDHPGLSGALVNSSVVSQILPLPLWAVLNTEAGETLLKCESNHVPPLLQSPQRLPPQQRESKIQTIAYKVHYLVSPPTSSLTPSAPATPASALFFCIVPRMHQASSCPGAFALTVPATWNALPPGSLMVLCLTVSRH